jgi:hypothetical protein
MKDARANEVVSKVVADKARRDFLKKAGTVALTAPAVAILLRASVASAGSINPYDRRDDCDPEPVPFHGDLGTKEIEIASLIRRVINHFFTWRLRF